MKYGFIYLWFDKKYKRYYVGCRWGNINDEYICSSPWMKRSYKNRPNDFKRRIIKTNIQSRIELFDEELRYLKMIKPSEIKPHNPNPKYYNLNITNNEMWHKYPDNIKTVGQKISQSKKGKNTGPRDPSVGIAISQSKKKNIAIRGGFTQEHKDNIAKAHLGKTLSKEEKQKISIRIQEEWNNGVRKRKEPVITMNREDQGKLCSQQLKSRWADPEWAANQKERLKQGAKNRPPRSNETKLKVSKNYLITYFDDSTFIINGIKPYCEENNFSYHSFYNAFQNKKSLNKYNIKRIELLKEAL